MTDKNIVPHVPKELQSCHLADKLKCSRFAARLAYGCGAVLPRFFHRTATALPFKYFRNFSKALPRRSVRAVWLSKRLLCAHLRSSGENICAPALVLDFGIRLSLNDLFNLESRRTKISCHLVGTEKRKKFPTQTFLRPHHSSR